MAFLRKEKTLLSGGVLVVLLLVVIGVLPFFATLGGDEVSRRLSQWSNYGQSFGIAAAIFAAFAFLCALYMVRLQHRQIEEASKQTQEAREQTKAVIEALNRQVKMLQKNAEMNGIAASLQYLIECRHMEDNKEREQMDEERKNLKERLDALLKRE